MKSIALIISKEYTSRIKKRSFLIMTILGPILIALIVIAPVYIAKIAEKPKIIGYVDETGFFIEVLQKSETEKIKFKSFFNNIYQVKDKFDEYDIDGLLYIPENAISAPSTIRIFSEKHISFTVISYIEKIIQREIESHKLAISGIDNSILKEIRTPVKINSILIDDKGKDRYTFFEVSMVLGIVGSILIYIFIFLFSTHVMRGVIEEKSSRIVEIIVSTVKPFHLMFGKIIGIALVGLTQFLLWVILSFIIITFFQVRYPDLFLWQKPPTVLLENKGLTPEEVEKLYISEKIALDPANKILEGIYSINFNIVISIFIFYFIFGYLLYASLFAAIGSAVENEAETQQFLLPITSPLIIAIILTQVIINNPDGEVAKWLSLIPFTSPVSMMLRIPFGVPISEIVLSMIILILTIVVTVWFAAKIYRTGILMYGKKNTFKELIKWIKYS